MLRRNEEPAPPLVALLVMATIPALAQVRLSTDAALAAGCHRIGQASDDSGASSELRGSVDRPPDLLGRERRVDVMDPEG